MSVSTSNAQDEADFVDGVGWEEMASAFSSLPSTLEDTIERHGLGTDCPVCVEALPPFWIQGLRQVAPCCGQWQCRSCLDERASAGEAMRIKRNCLDGAEIRKHPDIYQLLATCPLCRADLLEESETSRALQKAEQGKAWAMHWLACQYLADTIGSREDDERDGYPAGYYPDPDMPKGREFLRKAAAGGYPQSQYSLGEALLFGNFGFDKSEREGRVLLERAASQGHANAIRALAYVYRDDRSDTAEGRTMKFVETLKAAAELGHKPAALNLGYIYSTGGLNGRGLAPYPKSIEKASYYYEEGARPGEMGPVLSQIEEAANFYAQADMREPAIRHFTTSANMGSWRSQFSLGCLLILRPDVSLGVVFSDVTGFNALESCDFRSNVFPRGVDWLRGAAAHLDAPIYTMSLLCSVEKAIEQVCFGCDSRAQGAMKFKRCARCAVAHYCSRDCQVAHWHSKHKAACFKLGKGCQRLATTLATS